MMNGIPVRPAAAVVAAVTAWLLAAAPAGASEDPSRDPNPVQPVEAVDLSRYAGLWHEVAKIPNRFQKQCVGGTTTRYTLRDDGRIEVVNRCRESDGGFDEAKGVAKVEDAAGNAKLKVSFVSFLGWRPFWGDYWVIGLDPDYGWAVIGTPDRKYGWVLARAPQLDEKTMGDVFAILERNGYRRDAFEISPP
jgi:apolipoprotein D and lipocalin family protein